MMTTTTLRDYFGANGTWTYLTSNVELRRVQEYLPGVFLRNPDPYAINGSLWTLYSEVKCYALVAIIGLPGLLRPGRFLIPVAAMALYQALGRLHDPFAANAVFVALSWPFFIGAACYVYRASLPHSGWIAAALALCAAASRPYPLLFALMFPAALSYCVLWIGLVRIPVLLLYNRLGDYSYGMYIFAWPVQQVIVARLGVHAPWLLVALAIPTTLILSVQSWVLIEQPLLKRRHRIGIAVSQKLRAASPSYWWPSEELPQRSGDAMMPWRR